MFKELTPMEKKYELTRKKSCMAWSAWRSGNTPEEEYLRVNKEFLEARKEWIIADFGLDSYEKVQKQDQIDKEEAARPWGIERQQLADGLYDLRGCGILEKKVGTYTVYLAPGGEPVTFDDTDPETEKMLMRMLPDLRRMSDKSESTGNTE